MSNPHKFKSNWYSNPIPAYHAAVEAIKDDQTFVKSCGTDRNGGTFYDRHEIFSHIVAAFAVDSDFVRESIGSVAFQVSVNKIGIPFLYKGETVHILYKSSKINLEEVNRRSKEKPGMFSVIENGEKKVLPFDPISNNSYGTNFVCNFTKTLIRNAVATAYTATGQVYYSSLDGYVDSSAGAFLTSNVASVLFDVMNINTPDFDKRVQEAKLRKTKSNEKKETPEQKQRVRERFLGKVSERSEFIASAIGDARGIVPDEVIRWVLQNPMRRNEVLELFTQARAISRYGTMGDEELKELFDLSEVLQVLKQ